MGPSAFLGSRLEFGVFCHGDHLGVDGTLDGTGTAVQQQWLTSQLQQAHQAHPNNCIIIAVHQPPYSLDKAHSGYASIGNVIDRVHLHAVVDFLHFHWQAYSFPAFNIADSCITIGAALMLLESFLNSKKTDLIKDNDEKIS